MRNDKPQCVRCHRLVEDMTAEEIFHSKRITPAKEWGKVRDIICATCIEEEEEKATLPDIPPPVREEMGQEAYDLETIARFAELRTRLFVQGKIADQEHPVICAGETVVQMALRGVEPDAAVWWLQTMPSLPECWEAM